MRTLALALLLGSVALSAPASAAPKAPKPGAKQAVQHLQIGSVAIPHHEAGEIHGALTDLKIANQRRIAGFTFHKIVKGDFSGEYVLERNKKVTAFLDPADINHPRYAQRGEDWAHSGAEKIAPNRRVKFLVTPNRMHEHISSNLENEVSQDDLELALDTMKEARRLATQMGVINPRIYINNQNTASIGQLHVHVLGERPANFSYPSPMASIATPAQP